MRAGIVIVASGTASSLLTLAAVRAWSDGAGSEVRRIAASQTTTVLEANACPPGGKSVEDVKILAEGRRLGSENTYSVFEVDVARQYFTGGSWVLCGRSTQNSAFYGLGGERQTLGVNGVVLIPVRPDTPISVHPKT